MEWRSLEKGEVFLIIADLGLWYYGGSYISVGAIFLYKIFFFFKWPGYMLLKTYLYKSKEM